MLNIIRMIRDIIIKQKKEKEYLLKKDYIERTKFNQAKKWLNSDLVKVITGPRRAGKSVFAFMLLKNEQFGYFNFDDESILEQKINYDQLIKELNFVYGKIKYIFFDEIQNLDNWELFINRLYRQGYNLVITGSNAKLLSRELATALTGRHIPIEILPFDFQEFLSAKKTNLNQIKESKTPEEKADFLRLVEEYLNNGGYPEVIVKNFNAKEYLSILFDALLFKDVVKRYKIRFSEQIEKLASYLINNISNYYSYRRLTHILGFKSDVTLEQYLDYLEESYLIFTLSCFSYKIGERIKLPKKIYVVDNGFIVAKMIQFSPDKGRLMENLVFNELLKRGFKVNREVFYYRTRQKNEIDFIIKKNLKIENLIQVCYEVSLENKEREIKSLIEGSNELACSNLTIINWDYEGVETFKGKKIMFIPLWKWLIKM